MDRHLRGVINTVGQNHSKAGKNQATYLLFMYHAVTNLQLTACERFKIPLYRRIVSYCAQKSWDHKLISLASQIDGDEWQAFVLQLLYLRYGTNLIEVPDRHKGDSGIEAFSLDGCAFQCYAPEGPSDLAEICRKHKKKITRDLNKFRANGKELIKIFGTTKIQRWVLVVPDHCSSDVVAHCQSKTTEIRNLIPPLA